MLRKGISNTPSLGSPICRTVFLSRCTLLLERYFDLTPSRSGHSSQLLKNKKQVSKAAAGATKRLHLNKASGCGRIIIDIELLYPQCSDQES